MALISVEIIEKLFRLFGPALKRYFHLIQRPTPREVRASRTLCNAARTRSKCWPTTGTWDSPPPRKNWTVCARKLKSDIDAERNFTAAVSLAVILWTKKNYRTRCAHVISTLSNKINRFFWNLIDLKPFSTNGFPVNSKHVEDYLTCFIWRREQRYAVSSKNKMEFGSCVDDIWPKMDGAKTNSRPSASAREFFHFIFGMPSDICFDFHPLLRTGHPATPTSRTLFAIRSNKLRH